ncbi:MAG: J domain-containing protein [Parvularculaceae bacterium]
MFEKGVHSRSKLAIDVWVQLRDGDAFDAKVFVRRDERLIDLLNDERAFIPMSVAEDVTLIMAKTAITSITEIAIDGEAPREDAADAAGETASQSAREGDHGQRTGDGSTGEGEADDDSDFEAYQRRRAAARARLDPYAILRVSRSASLEEIRLAYKARIKAVHPDTIASLGLDEELEQAAMFTAQKVNRAYQAILAERRRADEQVRSLPGS